MLKVLPHDRRRPLLLGVLWLFRLLCLFLLLRGGIVRGFFRIGHGRKPLRGCGCARARAIRVGNHIGAPFAGCAAGGRLLGLLDHCVGWQEDVVCDVVSRWRGFNLLGKCFSSPHFKAVTCRCFEFL
uniref:Putative secreted protein n=1 Tax=Ixodes ricinus TaxID=34613 RepID=A0A6B0UQD8_IXORI